MSNETSCKITKILIFFYFFIMVVSTVVFNSLRNNYGVSIETSFKICIELIFMLHVIVISLIVPKIIGNVGFPMIMCLFFSIMFRISNIEILQITSFIFLFVALWQGNKLYKLVKKNIDIEKMESDAEQGKLQEGNMFINKTFKELRALTIDDLLEYSKYESIKNKK